MKRTGAGILALAALLGAVAGFLVDHALTVSGRPTFSPAVSLPIMLLLLAAVSLGLAWPIRRAIRGKTRARVNPFRALRIAILAKASSIVGAAVGGFALGLGAYLLTRPIDPPLGSSGTIIATAACGAVLVVAALVAEHFCTLPKDDDDAHAGSEPSPGAEPRTH
ncbi:MAG TPA: DUF3180 domain-containing protein [Microbacterium sp.]|uniref:DUF3180 domain-containing protein n=1 Tax=Microbacterium sp. TaxID=51671 RepID=UPI002CBEA61E|nr:DUF3180 domain-containing protein [Microbacterium sp.]HWI31104.1 DUF3180 domain-containing protein [Microbacterium sp.]